MIGAMLVLLVVIGGYVLLRDLNRTEPPSPVRSIDYSSDVSYAREQAGFTVLAPPELPEGWQATSARYVEGANERWHLGLLTDQDRYVGLEQAAASAESMVASHVDEDAERGLPVRIAGEPWSTWTDADGDLALVLEGPEVTTLVVGHEVPQGVLADFVTSLR
jgi:hypothetical protein